MALRICLVTPELPPYAYGGVGQYVLTLARQLHLLGHRVTVVGFRIHSDEFVRHDWGTSIALRSPVEKLPTWGQRFARATERQLTRAEQAIPLERAPLAWRLGFAWKVRTALAGALSVREYLRRRRSDFDVVEMPNYPGHGSLAPESITAPYVVRLSTPAAEGGSSGNTYLTALERRACRKARLLIAHSEAMSQKGASVYGLRSEDIAVIPLGLDDVRLEHVSRDANRMVMTYCGRAEPRKGTDLFLRALLTILPVEPMLSVRFIRADLDTYTSASTELSGIWHDLRTRFGDRIECVGTVTDDARNRLLASSDWSVIPSRFESFGLVAVESMRVGTAVIAGDVGGLREVCSRSPGNIMCASDSESALTESLRLACAAGKSAAAARGRLARACYLEHFQSRQMAEATVDAYERVVA